MGENRRGEPGDGSFCPREGPTAALGFTHRLVIARGDLQKIRDRGSLSRTALGWDRNTPWLTLELPLPQGNPFPWPKIKHGALPSPDNTSNPCPLTDPRLRLIPHTSILNFWGTRVGLTVPGTLS